MANVSDQQILEHILRGGMDSRKAIDLLFRSDYGAISRFVRANNGRKEDAEDIFQEVLVTFVGQVEQGVFKGECAISSYLYRIAYFKWMNELKRRKRLLEFQQMEKQKPDSFEVQPIFEKEFSEECKRLIGQIVGTLGDACIQILQLRFFAKQSFREIADQMGHKDEQVTRTKQYKCLSILRERYNGHAGLMECFTEGK